MSFGEAVRPRWRWARGVRARFVLILFLAVVLPNALLAVWLGLSARASALAVLEVQLHERLADAARTIGHSWIAIRSPLLTLAEDPRVLSALRDTLTVGAPVVIDVHGDVPGLDAVTAPIAFHDVDGNIRGHFVRPLDEGGIAGASTALLPVRVALFDPEGARLGSLQTQIALSSVLPPVYGWGAAAGAVPAVLAGDGTPLVQVSLEPLLASERRFEWDGQEWLAAHRAIREPELRLALAAPTAPNTAPFSAAARQGLVGLAIVLGFSVLLTLLLSRGVSAPIVSLVGAAEEVAEGRLDQGPVREVGPDEVRRLGRAFNRMTASLRMLVRRVAQQESAAAVGEFAASLAHEVRNPLTSVRIDLERTRERLTYDSGADALVARALKQVERLDATVAGALRIARSGTLELGPVDLGEPLAAALESAKAMLSTHRVRFAAWKAPDAPLLIRGNAPAVEQMVLNLLMNATEAVERRSDMPLESAVASVGLETAAVADAIELRVWDTGRGMSPEELERAIEPFYTTRSEGTGLGLTVVKRMVDAHGAEMTIESDPGRGTKVTIKFPVHSEWTPVVGRFASSSRWNVP